MLEHKPEIQAGDNDMAKTRFTFTMPNGTIATRTSGRKYTHVIIGRFTEGNKTLLVVKAHKVLAGAKTDAERADAAERLRLTEAITVPGGNSGWRCLDWSESLGGAEQLARGQRRRGAEVQVHKLVASDEPTLGFLALQE